MEIEEKIIQDPYGFIYITTNLVNGKRYLGQKRFYNGRNWRAYLGSGVALQLAFEKYGKENFRKDIIHVCYSDEELNKAEYDFSVFFDVVNDDNWYNLCYGGVSTVGYVPTEEQRKNQSEVAKRMWEREDIREIHAKINKERFSGENNPRYGIHLIGELNPMYGRQHTEESIQKMRAAKNGKYHGENNPNYGKHCSDDTKNKIRQNQSNTRPVIQLDFNFNVICTYDSLREAERITGFSKSNISNCCKHKTKQSHGFIWMFKDEYNMLITTQNE